MLLMGFPSLFMYSTMKILISFHSLKFIRIIGKPSSKCTIVNLKTYSLPNQSVLKERGKFKHYS